MEESRGRCQLKASALVPRYGVESTACEGARAEGRRDVSPVPIQFFLGLSTATPMGIGNENSRGTQRELLHRPRTYPASSPACFWSRVVSACWEETRGRSAAEARVGKVVLEELRKEGKEWIIIRGL